MELQKALSQIEAIHGQLARSQQSAMFRGWRAVPVAGSGLMAVAAGVVQAFALPNARSQIDLYLVLWMATAGIAVLASATEVYRCWRFESAAKWSATRLAISHFLPAVLTGGVLTAVIAYQHPASIGLLPGLWCLFYAHGMLAARRWLPPGIAWVAAYYLLAGAVLLGVGDANVALSPWAMPAAFGTGQLLAAAVLMEEGKSGV